MLDTGGGIPALAGCMTHVLDSHGGEVRYLRVPNADNLTRSQSPAAQ